MDLGKLPGRQSETASTGTGGSGAGAGSNAATGEVRGAGDGGRKEGAFRSGTGGTGATQATPAREVEAVRYDRDQDRELWVSGPEALLHIGVAIVIGYLVPNPFRWALSLVGLAAAAPRDLTGAAYEQSLFFIHDVPIALLALGLLFEALAIGVVRSRGLAWLAVGWTGMAGLASAAAFLYLQQRGQGIQLFPLISAIIGAYVAWSLALRLRGRE